MKKSAMSHGRHEAWDMRHERLVHDGRLQTPIGLASPNGRKIARWEDSGEPNEPHGCATR